MEKKKTISKVARECKEFRKSLGLRLEDISEKTEYSKEAISGFENGKSNNAYILLHYMNLGYIPPYAFTNLADIRRAYRNSCEKTAILRGILFWTFRESLNKSVQTVADECGVTVSDVINYEEGKAYYKELEYWAIAKGIYNGD